MMVEAHRIIGNIWVGPWESAKDFDGDVIFVHHDIQWYSKGLHIPLLSKRPNSDTDRTGAEVNMENLELIHGILDSKHATKQPTLVHCKGGVERSPLTVATWMAWKWDSSLEDAYALVMLRRPVVEDRTFWLP